MDDLGVSQFLETHIGDEKNTCLLTVYVGVVFSKSVEIRLPPQI